MSAYMEMIHIDSEKQARKTGLGQALETNARTWRAFNQCRQHAVAISDAAFLLDYYNKRGDLADTIPLNAEGFKAITGVRVLAESEYMAIDRSHWLEVRAEMEAIRFVRNLIDQLTATGEG